MSLTTPNVIDEHRGREYIGIIYEHDVDTDMFPNEFAFARSLCIPLQYLSGNPLEDSIQRMQKLGDRYGKTALVKITILPAEEEAAVIAQYVKDMAPKSREGIGASEEETE